MHKFLSTIITLFIYLSLSSQQINFEYIDTFRYVENGFKSPSTILNDIADDGTMVGSYEDQGGALVGLLIFPNGKITTYSFTGYTNTELTGINNAGFVLGRAYTSPATAIAFQARIVNGIVDQGLEINWNDPNGSFKKVGRLNDNDVGVGTARIGSDDWLHFESIISPFTVNQNERYSIPSPFTTYRTYGLGINNNGKYTGWYLDGVNRVPFVFDEVSDAFFSLAHFPAGSAQPRTLLNDINNNNRIAVSYRRSNGVMAGTVAQYNGANSINYDSQFQFITLSAYEILGINDNDDVVGYLENSNGNKVGLYILKEGPILDDFEVIDDILLFNNDSATFEYPNGTFDYNLRDEYLDIADSFYVNHLMSIPFAFNPNQLTSITSGIRNPSWPAFVRARNEDRSYITQNNGTKIPRKEGLVKWIEKSTDDFTGYCFGISAFALQNLSDPNLLLNRFSNAYTPQINAVNYDPVNIEFKEMFASLQLQQLDEKFDSIRIFQGALRAATEDGNVNAVAQIVKPLANDIIEGIKGGDSDSAYVMCFRTNFPTVYYHAVTPFKITRDINFAFQQDTFHCIDPNFDGNVLKVYVEYANPTNSRGYVNGTLVYGIDHIYHGSYLKDILPEQTVNFSGEAVAHFDHKSGNPNQTVVHVGELCDYSISNNANPAQSVSRINGVFSSNWESLGTFANMDDDGQFDFLSRDGVLDISAELSSCAGRNKISYTHPEGTFVYVREDVLPTETDNVLVNGNLQSIANTDNMEKALQLLVISSSEENTETAVSITDYPLNQDEMVSIETINPQEFVLTNEEDDDKNYDLNVSFVNPEYWINSTLSNIPISLETSHTIVIQPEVSGEEVVILVDEGLDGIVEDTLFGSVQPTGILDLQSIWNFRLFPNPTSESVNVYFETSLRETISLEILDVLGREITTESFTSKAKQICEIRLPELNQGIYMLRLRNETGDIIAIEKVLVE